MVPTKEEQLRLLRETKNDRPETVARIGAVAGPAARPSDGTGTRSAGDAAPCPREASPPGPSRGRPLNSERDKTLKATEPWKKFDPPISRRTFFRRKGK